MNISNRLSFTERGWGAATLLGALAVSGCDVGGSTPHDGSGGGGSGGGSVAVTTSSGPIGVGGAGGAGVGAVTSSTSSGPTTTASSTSSTGGSSHPMAPNGYYVEGNTVYDAGGAPHVFHGVARPSLEWSPTGEHVASSDFQIMKAWGARVVRLAMNQDFWLAGAAKHDGGYAGNIDQAIQWAHQQGLDVILDLHWSDRGDLGNQGPGQQRMADQNSSKFWSEVAAKYKSDGRVIFELYNEPHDVTWDVWLSGGQSGDGFNAVGMQQLYNAVRSAGADNLVIAGGLDWAFDLSGVPSHRIQGYNIMYASHPYDLQGKQPGNWENAWGSLAATDPVILTEFGTQNCSTGYYSQLLQQADAKKVSWTAWAWYPGGCNFPSVINDWSGTPSAPGQLIKAALLAYP